MVVIGSNWTDSPPLTPTREAQSCFAFLHLPTDELHSAVNF